MEQRVLEIVERLGRSEDKLLEILMEIQKDEKHHYLSKNSLETVAEVLDISLTKVYGIAEFYAMLSTTERGEHIIQVCNSAPCHVKNGEYLRAVFEEILGIKVGETTPDGMFSLEYTSCLGACDEAPAARIGESIYGNLDRSKVFSILSSIKRGDTDETTLV